MKSLIALALVAVPMASQALVLNANQTSNNGSGGIFMNLTPTTADLLVHRFDTMFSSSAGSAVQIQVYTRPGTYIGFQGSNAGWTLHETASATSAGISTMAGITLTNSIYLTAGQTMGVYIHSITTGGGIRYFGTGTTSVTDFSNADLALHSAHSRTGAVAFGGSMFTPRALTGNVHYTVVPEPATMAIMGLGLAALARRRRRA